MWRLLAVFSDTIDFPSSHFKMITKYQVSTTNHPTNTTNQFGFYCAFVCIKGRGYHPNHIVGDFFHYYLIIVPLYLITLVTYS